MVVAVVVVAAVAVVVVLVDGGRVQLVTYSPLICVANTHLLYHLLMININKGGT